MITKIQNALTVMGSNGIELDALTLDNKIHRIGPKKRQWYVARTFQSEKYGEQLSANYGDWREGTKFNYCSLPRKSSRTNKCLRKEIEKVESLAATERQGLAKKVGKKASIIWSRLLIEGTTPYVNRKKIGSLYGARLRGDVLVIPVCDSDGIFTSLQFIQTDGQKRFLTGGVVTGSYHVIGVLTADTILLAEGFATAASLHEATALPVVVAFNAGNLEPVALAIRARFPKVRIIVCGDDDHWTEDSKGKPHNVGRIKAVAAAQAVAGIVVLPTFRDHDTRPTDFNDLHVIEGIESVRTQILSSIESSATSSGSPAQSSASSILEVDRRFVEDGLSAILDAPEFNRLIVMKVLVEGQKSFKLPEIKGIFKSLVKERIKRQKAGIKEGGKKGTAAVSQPESALALPPGVRVPEGYELSADGIYRLEISYDESGKEETRRLKVISTPVVINKKTRNLETGAIGSQLWFHYDGKEVTENFTQETVASAPKIIKLADRGIFVTSLNAMGLLTFLDEQRAASLSGLPEIKTTDSAGWGWDGEKRTYALGRKVIHPDGLGHVEREYSSAERSIISAIDVSGSYEAWALAIRWIKAFSTPLFTIGASLAAPLLELVGVANFTVHCWNDSSEGKSTGLQAALSIWGRPTSAGLLLTWRLTSNGIEGRAKWFNSAPTPLDDSSQVASQKELVDTVYLLGNGTGKGRADKAGEGRKVSTFSTIGLSNGERPISTSTSLAGQEVRTIEIAGNPFIEKNVEMGRKVSKFKDTITKNYGHVAPKYIEHLVGIANDPEQLAKLRDDFHEIRKKRAMNVTEPLLYRTVDYFAVVELGLVKMQELFPEAEVTRADIDRTIHDTMAKQEERLKGGRGIDLRGLAYIWDQIISEPERFNDENNHRDRWGKKVNRRDPEDGQMQMGYAFLPTKLEELLREGEFNYGSITAFLRGRGAVWLDAKGQLYTVNFGGGSKRCFVFDRVKAIELGALEREAIANTEVQLPVPPGKAPPKPETEELDFDQPK